jgi:hypothetical protein
MPNGYTLRKEHCSPSGKKRMKIFWFSLVVLLSVRPTFPQATVNFANQVTGSGTGGQAAYAAPIYGVDPSNPTAAKTGQSAFGNPMGSVVYGGSPLVGTGFTVQLWGIGIANAPSDAFFILLDNATSSFGFSAGAGFILPVAGPASLPGTLGGPGSRGSFELRAWDNQAGAISTWDQAKLSQTALGVSPIVSPDFDLGGAGSPAPGLLGLQSFQLHIVPEPAAFALGLAGCLLLLAARSRQR